MSIGIVGASGLVGYNLFNFLRSCGEQVLGTYNSRCKDGLIKFDLLRDDFSLLDQCDIVVIAAAISDIDKCYLQKEPAYKINVIQTINLIKYLAKKLIRPIFLSSDQVFDGRKGNYTELDEPNPVNAYGSFKLQVEKYLQDNLDDYLTFRLSKTYSTNIADGGILFDIVEAFHKGVPVKSAHNLIFNPTDVQLVCSGIYQSIQTNLNGLYHLANTTIMSRYDFTCQIAERYGFEADLIEPVNFNDLPCKEKRALNSSLDVSKIHATLCLTS